MRPAGTDAQLAARRGRALALLAAGRTPTEVAKAVGAARRTIYRWQADTKAPQPKRPRSGSQRQLGRPARLNAGQLGRLERALERGAFAHGYAEGYWTLDRIGHLIWELFGVHYHPSGVWHVLNRMGWSCQKPQRRSLQRDDAAIAHWRRYIWPQIKKVP